MMVIAHKLNELLENFVCLLKYKKGNSLYSGFFTRNSKHIEHAKQELASFEAYNLILQTYEILDPLLIETILCGGGISDKIHLSFLNCKETLQKLKPKLSLQDYNSVIKNITNWENVTFCNGMTVEDLLFLIQFQANLPFFSSPKSLSELIEIASQTFTREEFLTTWFFETNLTTSCNKHLNFKKIKKGFTKTLLKQVSKEKKQIKKEWKSLIKIYPALFDKELSDTLNLLDNNVTDIKRQLDSLTVNSLTETELIRELATKVWPNNLQPNPFLYFC